MRIATVFAALTLTASAVFAEGDAVKGEAVFKKCRACHMVGENAKSKAGPHLNGIVGAMAAQSEGFRYSKALQEAGLTWDLETLDTFLASPRKAVKGTKMSFRGLRKAEDRADVIAYLATFSPVESEAAAEPAFAVAPEILALEGDRDYGEYLAGECAACHRADGESDGIPAIIGQEIEPFVTALHAYRGKYRENPVMQTISGRLSDDEIASLAVYFNSLGEPGQ